MTFRTTKTLSSLLLSVTLLFLSSAKVEGNLIVNGSFETGDFTGWTHATEPGSTGNWVIYSGINLPLSGTTFFLPSDGTFAAVADSKQPNVSSSEILYQDVTLPPGSATLQFSYAYHNYNNILRPPLTPFVIPSPDTLLVTGRENQQFRVDIMNPNALNPFSVNSPDVLQNLINTPPGTPSTQAYTTVSYDLSAFAGQTIRLRFAVASNAALLNLGIDGVSIIPGIAPPINLNARKINNRFLVQTNTFVQLTWQASPSDLVVGYNIYDNGNLIGTVPASGPFVFNAPFHRYETTVYGVAAFGSQGQESREATIAFEG